MSPRLLLAALLLATPALATAAPDDAVSTSKFRETHACGTRQIAADLASPQLWHAGPRTVFLNRGGGTYHFNSGSTNSATQNVNRGVSGDGRTADRNIPPLATGFNWPFIAQCVKDHYVDYDLVFTETRPAGGLYIEAVVGGSGAELGFPRDSLFGIAAADNFCGVTEAGIAFNFSETHRGYPRQDEELCATIAHEIGHLLALEHETLAADLMSYVPVVDAPPKEFADQVSTCGVEPGNSETCSCQTAGLSNRTNSHLRLNTYVGPRQPRLGQGQECVTGDQCAGGQCVQQDGYQFCTQECELANDTCPEGYECQSAGAVAVCAMPEGGCCGAGQRPGAGTMLAGLGVGLLIVRRRRKRADAGQGAAAGS